MNEQRSGQPSDPIWTVTTVLSEPQSSKAIILGIAVSLIPAVIVYLMYRPDLRQSLTMRGASLSRRFCQSQADMWQNLATQSAQVYNLARI